MLELLPIILQSSKQGLVRQESSMGAELSGGGFWGGACVCGLKMSSTDCLWVIRDKVIIYGGKNGTTPWLDCPNEHYQWGIDGQHVPLAIMHWEGHNITYAVFWWGMHNRKLRKNQINTKWGIFYFFKKVNVINLKGWRNVLNWRNLRRKDK